jgi:glycosyltransferase involved in cell wall biosynthesis
MSRRVGPLRILWASNAPLVGSGYGVQTAQVISRLKRDGHAVAVASNHGVNGFTLGWNEIPIFSPGLDGYGQDVIPPLYEKWKAIGGGEPTLIVTLFDVWVYKDPAFDPLPIASWVPVDHSPLPPEVRTFAAKHRMIAMSQFGQRMLDEAGVKADYVPHAVETSIFHPVAENRAREALNIPDSAFVVTIAAANKGNMPPRKGWNEMLTAWGRFAQRHDDVYLYIHTDLIGHNGVPIPVLLNLRAAKNGLPLDRVRHAPQPAYRMGDITAQMLNELYAMSDVLLSTSYGEGFGVPVIEAQAAGTPVIVSDATAQPELCGAGWIVRTQPYYDLTQGADFGIPIIEDIEAKLELAYEARGDRWLRDKAVEFAQGYEAEVVYQRHWKPLIADLERWIAPDPKQFTRQVRRAQARKRKSAA